MKKNKEDIEELEIEEENEELEEEEEELEEKPKKRHILLNIFIFGFAIILSVVFYAKYVGTKGLIVKEYRVDSNILTTNFSGLKIIHISDLLYKSTVDKSDVRDLVNKVNELRPDIIVFTGDLVNKGAKMKLEDNEFLTEQLSLMHANIGKYAIYGDYDYDYKSYDSVMNDSGFKILSNSYEEIFYKTNDSMYIVGLPSSLKDKINLEEAFKFYDELNRKYTICLVHEGASIKYINDSTYEVDLILGGHSLNGSVVIPFYGGLFKDKNNYKYSEPYYSKGITNIYISSGLGTKVHDYRMFNKPSFNFYRLKAQS